MAKFSDIPQDKSGTTMLNMFLYEKGWTVHKLAQQTFIPARKLKPVVEDGKPLLSAQERDKVADAIGVRISWLFDKDGYPLPYVHEIDKEKVRPAPPEPPIIEGPSQVLTHDQLDESFKKNMGALSFLEPPQEAADAPVEPRKPTLNPNYSTFQINLENRQAAYIKQHCCKPGQRVAEWIKELVADKLALVNWDGMDWITLPRLAELTQVSQSDLSALCRLGIVKAEKRKGIWYIKRDTLPAHILDLLELAEGGGA